MSIGTSPFQGGGGASVADATETTAGKIRIATSTEAGTGTNDTTAMTPLTVKERIDAALVGGVEYKGTFNANTGLTNSGGNLNNAEKGDLYIIDTLGTIYGQTWAVGDHLLINDNMGGSIDNSKIDKVDNTDAVTSVNGLSGPVVLNGGNVDADYSASNYNAANANIDGHLEGIDDQFLLTAPLASPALTGNPTAPTQSASDNSTKIATTFYVDRAVSAGGASDASETTKGIIEIATNTEAQAASATDKALVPSNISNIDLSSFNNDLSGLGNQINALQIKTGASFTAQANYVYIGGYSSGTQTITMPAASGATSGDIIGFTSNVASRALSLVSSDGTTNDIVNQSNQAKGGSNGALSLAVNQQISWFIHSGTSWYEANAAPSAVTTSGAYSDLSGTPTLGTAAASAATDFQPVDPGLTSIAALTTSANKMIFTDGSDSYDTTDLTAFARSLLDDTDATTARATLSLGSAALLAADNTADNVVKLDSNGKLPAIDGSQLTNLPSGATQLNDLSDVTITGAATGEVLRYSGSAWVDATLAYSDLSGTPTLGTAAAAAATDFQSADPGLASIAALTTAADKMIYTNGSDSYQVTGLTAQARALLDDADAATMRTTLGAIAELSDDSSPQLGGALDVNGNAITSASNGLVEITPNGTGAVKLGGNTNPAELRFFDEGGNNYIALKAPADASISADETFTLPATDGTNGQVLQTNGSGVLSFVDQSGGGGGSNATLNQETLSADKTISTPSASRTIFVFTSSADRVINLPAASDLSSGQLVDIKSMSNVTLTITPNGTDNLDGSSGGTLALNVQYSSVTLVCDGTDDWFIV